MAHSLLSMFFNGCRCVPLILTLYGAEWVNVRVLAWHTQGPGLSLQQKEKNKNKGRCKGGLEGGKDGGKDKERRKGRRGERKARMRKEEIREEGGSIPTFHY